MIRADSTGDDSETFIPGAELSVAHKLMIQRQCPECTSELVRARRADTQHATGLAGFSSPGWRCSVCGREFTTEQVRESKRSKSIAVEPA